MPLPTINPTTTITLTPEPLTPAAFEDFGTVIAPPLSRDQVAYPGDVPAPMYSAHQPVAVPANQLTALKTSPISPLINNYANSKKPGAGLMSMFSSFPRRNTYESPASLTDKSGLKLKLKLGILERHSYTTQTFSPFSYSISTSDAEDKTYMLVVVAPTLKSSSSEPVNPPDLTRVRAFVAPLHPSIMPTMAVTYGPGTWHAPMIVLGCRRVDFLVSQFANGIANDDVQEVLIGTGPDKHRLDAGVLKQRRDSGIEPKNIEIDITFVRDGWATEQKWVAAYDIDHGVQERRGAKL